MTGIKINDEEPIFTISAAAKLLDISVPTLRLYEKEDLFIPFKTITRQRLFSKSDIARIICIRRLINELKIGINGIKILYSFIPCWGIKGCNSEGKEKCNAYSEGGKPCWAFKPSDFKSSECRNCGVYKKYSECCSIKEAVKIFSVQSA